MPKSTINFDTVRKIGWNPNEISDANGCFTVMTWQSGQGKAGSCSEFSSGGSITYVNHAVAV